MDINIELFRRFKALKKIDIINNATEDELLNCTLDTINKCIKSIGTKYSYPKTPNNKNINVNIPNIDSQIVFMQAIGHYNQQLYMTIYDSANNVEFDLSIPSLIETIANNTWPFSQEYLDEDKQVLFCVFTKQQISSFIRNFLITYINLKYKL